MKLNSIVYVVILLVLNACQQSIQDSFMGTITYKLDAKITNDQLPQGYRDYYLNHFGDSDVVKYDKQGNTIVNYYGSNNLGFNFIAYSVDQNCSYSKFNNSDTIYKVDCSKNALNLVEMGIDDNMSKTILDRKCKAYKVVGIDTKGSEEVTQVFYFDGEPFIDPQRYQRNIDFFTAEVLKEISSVYLGKITWYKNFSLEYTATSISEVESIENIDFNFGEGALIKIIE